MNLPFTNIRPTFPEAPEGGMASMAGTREQSILDLVASTTEFQKAYPDIGLKGRVVEPVINMTFDIEEKLDPLARFVHESHFERMFEYLASDEADAFPKAVKAFWDARECLVGSSSDILEQFDAMYKIPKEGPKPVPAGLSRVRALLRLKRNMAAEQKEKERPGEDGEVVNTAAGMMGESGA
ncbi:hypothetical protein B0T25DRAFT_302150 [Lasiosphaeria hispida]|uniref:Uncharacterized protein n=1 Tax=Lasiosphaeria hispida TaxID=260671 RepID=A0AAJ0M978_9PEZI|nr:hypothetical protein B0T25DRAFT_302150 [Lasiosphaeria hispida]